MSQPEDDPLWKEAVASAKLTKHSDDIRRGLRNPKRYNLAWTAKAEEPQSGAWVEWSEVEPLLDELYVLRNKVKWLQQADKLVIWDGQQWKVRHQVFPGSLKNPSDA